MIDLDTRNAFETRNILETFQVTRKYLLDLNEMPIYEHSSRIDKHFFLTEILLSVIALESYVYGMSNHFSYKLPNDMPNTDKTKRAIKPMVSASLEYKLLSYMNEAKKRITYLRVNGKNHSTLKGIPRNVRSEIIKAFNVSFKQVVLGLKVRNKLAHGETFNALNSSKKKKKNKLSKFIREIKKEEVQNLVGSIHQFKELCDSLFRLNANNAKSLGVSQFVSISSILKRNDFLAMVGMQSSGTSFSIIGPIRNLSVHEAVTPEGFENVHGSFVVRMSGFMNGNKKKIAGVTKKFLTNNGFKLSRNDPSPKQVEGFLIEKYWNVLKLTELFKINGQLATEIYFYSINTSPAHCALVYQRTLNDLCVVLGSKTTVNESGTIDKDTLKVSKRLKKYYKTLIKIFLHQQINFFLSDRKDKNKLKVGFRVSGRFVYSSKQKVIDYSRF